MSVSKLMGIASSGQVVNNQLVLQTEKLLAVTPLLKRKILADDGIAKDNKYGKKLADTIFNNLGKTTIHCCLVAVIKALCESLYGNGKFVIDKNKRYDDGNAFAVDPDGKLGSQGMAIDFGRNLSKSARYFGVVNILDSLPKLSKDSTIRDYLNSGTLKEGTILAVKPEAFTSKEAKKAGDICVVMRDEKGNLTVANYGTHNGMKNIPWRFVEAAFRDARDVKFDMANGQTAPVTHLVPNQVNTVNRKVPSASNGNITLLTIKNPKKTSPTKATISTNSNQTNTRIRNSPQVPTSNQPKIQTNKLPPVPYTIQTIELPQYSENNGNLGRKNQTPSPESVTDLVPKPQDNSKSNPEFNKINSIFIPSPAQQSVTISVPNITQAQTVFPVTENQTRSIPIFVPQVGLQNSQNRIGEMWVKVPGEERHIPLGVAFHRKGKELAFVQENGRIILIETKKTYSDERNKWVYLTQNDGTVTRLPLNR